MGCTAVLDFAAPPSADAHLSFYWTMDEGGAIDKVDSAAGLSWTLTAGTLADVGLFGNGTGFTPAAFGQHGLSIIPPASNPITIIQSTSTGLSVWFWIKVLVHGAGPIRFILDTDNGAHTNLLRSNLVLTAPATGVFGVDHVNDTDTAQLFPPNLAWAVGAWHMVAFTYNKTAQTLNAYIDGVLVATGADPFVYPDLTDADFSFKHVSANPEVMDVVIDEFGLSTKGALTQAQVTALYNGGAGVTWPNITPIVPYP